jgi:hypothetical protein
LTQTLFRLLLALAGCLVTFPVTCGVETVQQNVTETAAPGMRVATVSGFAPVGDTQLYYEVHGAGEPILFLHGGGGRSSAARFWTAGGRQDRCRF